MTTTLDIVLNRVNKVYRPNEDIAGRIVFESKNESKHEGITLLLEGTVNMQLSSKNVGLFEAFYNSVKPITLISYAVEVSKGGRIPLGRTEIPFELPLKPKGRKTLFETYHGVFITIQYTIKCEVKRSMLTKDLIKVIEFMVESPEGPTDYEAKPVSFTISPESLKNVKSKDKIPKFQIRGHLDSVSCLISKPFTGEICVESCGARIRSIELQLVRVETCGSTEGYAKEPTEVQNIQVADGDVARGLPIPLFMVFPRLFTCPTLMTANFKIEFEINVVVIFEDNHLVTENFPIKLLRLTS